MKCLQIIVTVIGVALQILCVLSRNIEPAFPDCNDELRDLNHHFDACAPRRYEITQIVDIIEDYRNLTSNSTQFSLSVIEYCATLKNASSCSMARTESIPPDCRDFMRIQYLRNLMRVITRMELDLCSLPIIYEIANDKGYECLQGTKLKTCVQTILFNDVSRDALIDANICKFTRRIHTCSEKTFSECEHDGNIQKYINSLVNDVLEDFACQ